MVFSYNFCTFALQNKQFNSLTNAIQKYCSNNNNKLDYRYNDEKIFDALKSGASGYILKRAAIEEIFASLDDLLSGGSPMSNIIARKVVQSFNKNAKLVKAEFNLSKRENELLDMLAQGKRIKEIADDLCIAVSTVRKHIRNIYDKLQVQSRTEALNKTHRGFK